MHEVSLERILDVSPDTIFDVMSEYESFEEMLPRHAAAVRVMSVRGSTAVLQMRLVLSGRRLAMTTKHVCVRPSSHTVYVLGGDAKGSIVEASYEPAGEGTRVRITARLRLRGRMLLDALLYRGRASSGLGEMLDEFAGIAAARESG